MSDVSIYVTIGNSDDRLTQAEWADYRRKVDIAIREALLLGYGLMWGAWVSPSTEPFQNACWCFSAHADAKAGLRIRLKDIAGEFDQDSIAWAQANPEFLPGRKT